MENATIDFYAKRYYDELIDYRSKMNSWARAKIKDKEEEILGGLVKAIHDAIPEGKWRSVMEKTFSFEMHATDTPERISLWDVLNENMTSTMGLLFISIRKEDVLDSGFTSWKNFFDELDEFNEKISSVIRINDMRNLTGNIGSPGEDFPKLGFHFRVTCTPKEYFESTRKFLEEVRQEAQDFKG